MAMPVLVRSPSHMTLENVKAAGIEQSAEGVPGCMESYTQDPVSCSAQAKHLAVAAAVGAAMVGWP